MNKYLYNYHSHTFRCEHANGKDEEYIQEAIKFGLKEYGVSDHIFLPGVIQRNMRGRDSCLIDYLESFNNLKNKYKDKINIHIGFEAEYIPEFISYYKDLIESKKVEYLILGQHCYYSNNEIKFYGGLPGMLSIIRYTDDLIEGMKSGLFKYVAHPDLFMLLRPIWDDVAIKCAEKIIAAAIELDLPLEINLAQARMYGRINIQNHYSYIYPFIPFWKMVSKTKAHVIYGFDSHTPLHVSHPGEKIIEDIISETGVIVDFNYKI